MLVARTTETEVLKRIRSRVISSHPRFSENNVQIEDAPLPVMRPDMPFYCTICCEMSHFEDNSQGPCDVIEKGRFYVTPIISNPYGPTGQLTGLLIGDTDDALIRVLKPILLTSLLHETTSAGKGPWMPLDENGDRLFLNNPRILSCLGPKQYEQWPATYMPLIFEFTWVWKFD